VRPNVETSTGVKALVWWDGYRQWIFFRYWNTCKKGRDRMPRHCYLTIIKFDEDLIRSNSRYCYQTPPN